MSTVITKYIIGKYTFYEATGECRDPLSFFEDDVSKVSIGDVVIVNKEGDENFEREGPIIGKSGDYRTGEKIDVHFEDHVKRYDLGDVRPTGQKIPESTIDRLPKYNPKE